MSGNTDGEVVKVSTTLAGRQFVIVKVKNKTYGLHVPASLSAREGMSLSLKIDREQVSLA